MNIAAQAMVRVIGLPKEFQTCVPYEKRSPKSQWAIVKHTPFNSLLSCYSSLEITNGTGPLTIQRTLFRPLPAARAK